MKLFLKVFLSTLIIITLALGASGYFLISANLEFALENEIQTAGESFRLISNNLISNILVYQNYGVITDARLFESVKATCGSVPGLSDVKIYEDDGDEIKLLCETVPGEPLASPESEPYKLTHSIVGKSIVSTGSLSQCGRQLYIYEARDISSIFEQTDGLLNSYRLIYCIVLTICVLTLLVLFYLLTRPIKKLTEAANKLADGQYDTELQVRSNDEIGALTENFISMTKTIRAKIAELELNARQKEDFTANFAHELKTPLTSIVGYADVIYQDKQVNDSVHSAAGYILNEGLRLEELSKKLMDLIVLNNQDFVLIEMRVDEILNDAIETLLPIIEERKVKVTLDSVDSYITVEPDLFKTMLLNLLDNAMKAGAQNIKLQAELTEDGKCRISITDDGCGIPEQELSRITEAFYMVDKSRSRKQHGAGLGLALSVKIAAVHNTMLIYKSEVGKGTRVHFDMEIREEL